MRVLKRGAKTVVRACGGLGGLTGYTRGPTGARSVRSPGAAFRCGRPSALSTSRQVVNRGVVVGVPRAELVALGAGAVRVANPDREAIGAGRKAGGIPGEGRAGRVGLQELIGGAARR